LRFQFYDSLLFCRTQRTSGIADYVHMSEHARVNAPCHSRQRRANTARPPQPNELGNVVRRYLTGIVLF
jgi:hypothetical protein